MRYWIRVVLILAGALLMVCGALLLVARRAPSTARLVAHSDFGVGNRDIHLRVPGSDHATNITNDPAIDTQPTWSPDGEWIAFVTDRDTPPGKHPINSVYLMRRDGSDLRKLGLASPTTGTRTLTWSPDSQWLYVKYVMQGWWDNYLVRIEDGHSISLRLNNTFTVLSKWSPNEAMLAYRTNIPGSLDDDETAIERVRPGDGSAPDVRSSFVSGEQMYNFAWSADGQWFAMTGLNGLVRNEHVLQRRHPDGSDPLTLFTSDVPFIYLAWSPDGQRIAFVTGDGDGSRVYLIHSDGSDDGMARRLNDAPGFFMTPAWSPDGSTLVYAGYDGSRGTLYQLNMADDQVRSLYQSSAFIHHVAWASDGEWIYFASGSREQAQLYQIRPQGGESIYLTDTAFDWEVPVSPPISLKLRSEFALLAGLLLAMGGAVGHIEAPPVPSGRRFVLNK